jgi:PAS domain S-box-containing protein
MSTDLPEENPKPKNEKFEPQDPEVAPYWLSALVQSADDAIISKTLEGIITSWNAGATRIFGYTADEAIGKSITMLIPEDHPDEEPGILARIHAGHRVEHYETVRVRKDGSLVDISLTISPIRDATDKIIGASKIARDIGERKRAEKALREQAEIIETVNTVGQTLAAELDLQKLVQAVTDAATDICGAKFGSFFFNVLKEEGESYMLYALSGVPLEMFAHFPMPRNTDLFGPTFAGEGTILLADVTADPRYGKNSPYYGMPAGHLPVVSYLAVPVVLRSGEVYGGLFFGHPEEGMFTERSARIIEGLAAQSAIALDNARLYEASKKATTQAEQAVFRAEQSSRIKEEFLATISHELRTPLNAILGWTKMLRTGKMGTEDAGKALETIERNARAQSKLIDDLLDVSRIITGKLRMDVRPTDPTSFTDAAIEAIQPAAVAKGISIRKIIDTGAVSVPGDPVRLQQVVWNLLSNAVKFTPKGGRVEVRLERINSHIEILIKDTGQGIPSEFLPHVFDRFRQADQTSTRQHGGMGLGLAIVRHLVELHGGTVSAISEGENRGSTFIVRLPVSPVYQADDSMGRIHPSAEDLLVSSECVDRLDGIRILVVDDELDTRELLRVGLKECGASVAIASSVNEALEQLNGAVFDVLISDIGMPMHDGYDLIRRLRTSSDEHSRRMPAIALTAYARAEDRMRALRSGYQMHVPKPVELNELVTVILSLVGR